MAEPSGPEIFRTLSGDPELDLGLLGRLTAGKIDGFVEAALDDASRTATAYDRQYEWIARVLDRPTAIDAQSAPTLSPSALGALRFLLLSKTLDSARQNGTVPIGDIEDDDPINVAFEDHALRTYFSHWYELSQPAKYLVVPEDREIESKRFLPRIRRIGTTSFLVSCCVDAYDSEHRVALKCLIPRYVSLPDVRGGPGKQLDQYQTLQKAVIVRGLDVGTFEAHVARVTTPAVKHPEDAKCVEMDFVRGLTLEDRINAQVDSHRLEAPWTSSSRDGAAGDGAAQPPRSRAKLRAMRRIVSSLLDPIRYSTAMWHRLTFVGSLAADLCPVLNMLTAVGQAHRDLSPSNVIVRAGAETGDGQAGDSVPNLVLVDFGRNTLLDERVGSDGRLEHIEAYIAPEIRERRRKDVGKSDLYSFGVIVLDALRPKPEEQLTKAVVKNLIEELWTKEPALAEIVEGLLDDDPDARVVRTDVDSGTSDFDYVRRVLLERVGERRAFHARQKDRKRLVRLWRILFPERRGLLHLAAALGALVRAIRKPHDPPKEPGGDEHAAEEEGGDVIRRYLAVFDILHELVWVAILALAIGITLSEWRWSAEWVGSKFPPALSHWLQTRGAIGDLSAHLPGRIVALSTAFIGIAYYRHILSGLTAWKLGRRRAMGPEAVMRFGILLALGLQLYSIITPSRWLWAVLGGAGGVFVAAINAVFLWLVHAVDTERSWTVGERFREFHRTLRPWPLLMLLYSSGGIIIGLLLWRHVASDTWVYAAIMAGVNYLKLYWWNIVADAPRMRGNLARTLFLLARQNGTAAEAPERSTVEQPAAATSRAA